MELKKLNLSSFEEIIYDKEEPCLVIFSRKSCYVCKEVIPVLEDISEKYIGKFGCYYVDVEDQRDLFNRFSLKGVPQILFFNNGEYFGKLSGNVESEDVEDKINEIV